MHTKSYHGITLDIDKLIEILKDRPNHSFRIDEFDWSSIDIRKQSGFSEKRYINCDIDVPIIIDEKRGIIDGRHRLLKRLLFNKKHTVVKIAHQLDLLNCVVKDV